LAFQDAIENLDVSIAVINVFLYLTRFLSPVRISTFVHFGVDISDFIKFLPQSVPLMRDLGSRGISCGR
jgi:hypothetical protein